MERRELGAWGEERAAKYLRGKGYTILERNFRCRSGEIDIIARRGGIITFVEVKLRRDADFAEAREFVTAAKQRRFSVNVICMRPCRGPELSDPRSTGLTQLSSSRAGRRWSSRSRPWCLPSRSGR